MTHLFCDRLLTDLNDTPAQRPASRRRSHADLIKNDQRAEWFDTFLQMMLVVCLLTSFVVCGLHLGNVSAANAAQAVAARQRIQPAPAAAAEVAQAPQPTTPARAVAVPAASLALTL